LPDPAQAQQKESVLSELHKFLFDGLPVRGMIVRLTDAWQEILARRASNTATGAYPPPVAELLGEMTAAATLMQSNIKFNGALILQIFGDGPVKVAVAEAKPDLSLRATAKVIGDLPADARLPDMVNVSNKGRCAITLDPKDKLPGAPPTRASCRFSATKARSSASSATCCSTTCCRANSSTPRWC
jgi:molecular chaperone Hsp33